MHTWDIKFFCFIIFCFIGHLSYSQSYIGYHSDNYTKEVNNPVFCHTYKIDGYWRQTYVYYEMADKGQFNHRIEIENKSYDNEWELYTIQLHIDELDTLILTTSNNNTYGLFLDSIPSRMTLTIHTLPSKKVQVPINEKEIPSKIIILWGDNESHGILTIRSKKELDEKTIRSIQRDVSEGKYSSHFDEYYYFISDM